MTIQGTAMTKRSKGVFLTLALVLIAALNAPEPIATTHHGLDASKNQLRKQRPSEQPLVLPVLSLARSGALLVDGGVDWTGGHKEKPASDVPAANSVRTSVLPFVPETTAPAPVELRGPSIVQPPAMPFAYLGHVTQAGERKALLLEQGRPVVVSIGGKVGSSHTLLAMQPGELVFRYEPWGVEQSMSIGSIDESDETVIRN